MALISFSQNGLTPFQQLLGHNKDILEKWISLEECFFGRDTLSAKLKEEVRRTLAFNNGCEYCKAKGALQKTKWIHEYKWLSIWRTCPVEQRISAMMNFAC